MNFEFLKLEKQEGVALLTLSRPATLNSWNQKMRDELREAVRSLVADNDIARAGHYRRRQSLFGRRGRARDAGP